VNATPPIASDLNPAIPKAVARVIEKLLSKRAEDRYPGANEALEDLDRASRDLQAPSSSDHETIAVPADDDVTTQLSSAVPLVRRPVSPLLFFGITLLLAATLVASVITLRKRAAAEKPAAVLTPAQIHEAAAKERALDAARALTQQGRYEDAIRDYDVYLARYPHSVVARTEREEAQRLFETSKPKAEITEVGPRPKKKQQVDVPPEPPKPPPGKWQRFRKWLRGK
jgi:hypothetical protein